MMAHFAIWMCRLAFMSFVVAPLLALLWRRRRYLADATAVQLCYPPRERQPDSETARATRGEAGALIEQVEDSLEVRAIHGVTPNSASRRRARRSARA